MQKDVGRIKLEGVAEETDNLQKKVNSFHNEPTFLSVPPISPPEQLPWGCLQGSNYIMPASSSDELCSSYLIIKLVLTLPVSVV